MGFSRVRWFRFGPHFLSKKIDGTSQWTVDEEWLRWPYLRVLRYPTHVFVHVSPLVSKAANWSGHTSTKFSVLWAASLVCPRYQGERGGWHHCFQGRTWILLVRSMAYVMWCCWKYFQWGEHDVIYIYIYTQLKLRNHRNHGFLGRASIFGCPEKPPSCSLTCRKKNRGLCQLSIYPLVSSTVGIENPL